MPVSLRRALPFFIAAALLTALLAAPALTDAPNLDQNRKLHLSPTGGVDLNAALVAFWKLDEASGVRYDAIGDNDLTDNNTVGQADGKIGNAAQFVVENNEHLSHIDNPDLSVGDIDFTIAAWVLFDSVTAHRTFFAKWSLDNEYVVMYQKTTNHFRFCVTHDGSTLSYIDSTLGPASLGVWYLVVAWHDSVNNTLNIQVNNGTVDSAPHALGAFDGTSPFQISGTAPTEQIMDGRVDAVGLWKGRCLTAAERTELWNGGNGKEPPF